MSPTPERPFISLMRPLLVQHDYIIPYLRQIDENRWYSNFGPLVQQLESRLADFFHTGERSVVTVSNGTAGLTNTLRAMNLPRGSVCLLPAWTFIATPAAVIAAGLSPHFVDVNEQTWALDPQEMKQHIKTLGGTVSVVMTVAPFGTPQDTAAWDAFTDETGIPVIIDAAAGFDAFTSVERSRPGKNPVMVSMHATKMFGVGEGGVVVSTNTALIQRIREMSNFGFSEARTINVPGTNGKMSEYSAAVALATLDLWPQLREMWICRKWYYKSAFTAANVSSAAMPGATEDWGASTFNIRLQHIAIVDAVEQLRAAGIESRQWWGKGCHVHPAYAPFPRMPLPATIRLGNSVLALPFTLDIHEPDVDYIVQNVCRIDKA